MRIIAAAVWALLVATAAQAQAPPASTERIREALQRPALEIPPLPEVAATFRATVVERLFPVGTVLEEMWRDIGANPTLPGQGPLAGRAQAPVPLVGVDVLPLLTGLWNGIGNARRASAERAAKKEVQ